MSCAHRCTVERWCGLFLDVGKATVYHRGNEFCYITLTGSCHKVLFAVGSGFLFHVEIYEHNGLLGVFVDGNYHFVVVGNGIVNSFGRVCGLRNIGKCTADFLFHLVHINVAHHDNGLQVGAIPFLIVVAQVFIREVVYNIHRANRQAIFVFRAFVDHRKHTFHHSLHCHSCPTRAPFLVDNATFFVYFVVVEQEEVAPVVQNKQSRIYNSLAFYRHGRYIVDGLFYAGVGV